MNNFVVSKIAEDIPEAASLKFSMMAVRLRQRGRDIIILSTGDVFFDLPLFSFNALPYKLGYHYSDPRGLQELREHVSRYYQKEYGVASNPEREVLVSAGSKVLIYLGLASVLNAGDEVILFEPAWASYSEQVKIAHGVPVLLPYYEDVSNIKNYLTKKTRAIIINNPHNPSGKVYSHQ